VVFRVSVGRLKCFRVLRDYVEFRSLPLITPITEFKMVSTVCRSIRRGPWMFAIYLSGLLLLIYKALLFHLPTASFHAAITLGLVPDRLTYNLAGTLASFRVPV
jgi:hypothetical protein